MCIIQNKREGSVILVNQGSTVQFSFIELPKKLYIMYAQNCLLTMLMYLDQGYKCGGRPLEEILVFSL
jgi:hypothetical protein